MKGVDLNLLRALDAILSERNVTRAAARLAISQPALSQQLARARVLFDDPLLVPALSGRGMVPTPRALAIQASLRDALARVDEIVVGGTAFDPLRSRRNFTLLANDNAATIVGVPLMARIRATGARAIRVAFLHPTDRDTADRLEQGEIDIVIGSGSDMAEGLMQKTLLHDRFLVAQRKGHPRGNSPLSIEAYCACDHVIVSGQGGAFASEIDRLLADRGGRRQVALSVQTYGLAPAMVAGSDLLCTLPSRFLEAFRQQLEIFELPFASPVFSLSAYWHLRSHADAAHIWLRRQLSEAMQAD